MIHEEICTYEVAKLAKEKGFPQHIGDDAYIVENEYDDKYEVGCHYPIQFIPDYLPTITAPTQSLLQRWLRDNHQADVWVEPVATMVTKTQRCYYWHIAYDSDGSCIYILDSMLSYSTYEKALEEGLKEAIIEFVEERK